jgi:hypothetical protein
MQLSSSAPAGKPRKLFCPPALDFMRSAWQPVRAAIEAIRARGAAGF